MSRPSTGSAALTAASGWNILSIPFTLASMSATSVSRSNQFRFNFTTTGGYNVINILRSGTFLARFPQAVSKNVSGNAVTTRQIRSPPDGYYRNI